MLRWMFDTFVAPPHSQEGSRAFWYLWIGLSTLALWVFFWWSIGMMPSTAFGDGFAKQEDVIQIRISMLEERLLDLRIHQCNAATDSESRYFFFEQLQRRTREYYTLTGTNWTVPSCEEVT